jgi:branched-chain amino acid transport system substrate-binding protein
MRLSIVLAGLAIICSPALAEETPVKVGVILSTTGPAASFGIPEKNTIQLAEEADKSGKLKYVILDDASDPTNARKNVERLIAEDHVDAVIGSSTTPSSLAMIEAVAKGKTAMMSVASSGRIVEPMDTNRHWVFKASYNDNQLADVLVRYMKKSGVSTAGYIGFNDAYGESWASTFETAAAAVGIKVVASERYSPRDTSTVAQILKLMVARPDAILIGASGTPAVLPETTLKGRGYTGQIYQTSGSTNTEFLRVGGKDVEGTILPAAPVLVSEQLRADHPSKKAAGEYKQAYEAKFGAGSVTVFGANTWDATLLVRVAAEKTLAQGLKPGTAEFRTALRDNLERTSGLMGSLGVASFDEKRHSPYADAGPVIVAVNDGAWKLVSE